MRIYTRTGDDGSTGLIGGARVKKSDPRIECYGTIDELNAVIGLAAVNAHPELVQMLRAIQAELFVIGARLATPQPTAGSAPTGLQESAVARLESEIDSTEAVLPPLRNFILPGGSELSARLHVARTVCRRAERLLAALGQHESIERPILVYLNRLSDWLFVQARMANHRAGIADIPWQG